LEINNLTIEFLAMEGCDNLAKMWDSLQDALKELQLKQSINKLDLIELSEKHDLRAGFGSPTILVDGKDLFDAPFPATFHPSCRYYAFGLPSSKNIVEKLKLYL
jgi:hypothetical protein